MSRQKQYWLCQLLGWGLLIAFTYFIASTFGGTTFLSTPEKHKLFLHALFFAFVGYIAATHLLRVILIKIKWLSFSPTKILLTLIIGVIVTTFSSYIIITGLEELPSKNLAKYTKAESLQKAKLLEKELNVQNTDYYLYENSTGLDSTKYKSVAKIKMATKWYRDKNNNWQFEEEKNQRIFGELLNGFLLISLWTLIYAVFHYVEKNRNNQIDKLKLEAVVKSLELKTIKSHINPHFIFNALNSIRALVDENPNRARTAITELSNILRSSLQAEKLEVVPLKQELEIVKDYLALEQMRFEERLSIKLEIDPDTLEQPIPPMMLQTLVENAIKHGISKQEAGGIIIIKSFFDDYNHIIMVENTGNLMVSKDYKSQGFGIKGTQDRLNLLYQNKANFHIVEQDNNTVISKITMPIKDIV
jgi:two-component system, LytTR family, sensor kinase